MVSGSGVWYQVPGIPGAISGVLLPTPLARDQAEVVLHGSHLVIFSYFVNYLSPPSLFIFTIIEQDTELSNFESYLTSTS